MTNFFSFQILFEVFKCSKIHNIDPSAHFQGPASQKDIAQT